MRLHVLLALAALVMGLSGAGPRPVASTANPGRKVYLADGSH